jgi:hypothetical protein
MKFAWIGLGVATLALVAWIALRPHAQARDGDPAIRAVLERIERAQAQQTERIERLERRVAPSSAAVPIPRGEGGGVVARTGNTTRGNGTPLDPVRAAARQQAKLRALDDRLVAEPLSAAWAAEQEKRVDAFLSPAHLAREGLPPPSAHEARCQSRLCRIRLAFADESTASAAQVALVQAIAPGLPNARSFVLARPDGGADLVVYAGSDAQAVR